jgi:hypothetical protein
MAGTLDSTYGVAFVTLFLATMQVVFPGHISFLVDDFPGLDFTE